MQFPNCSILSITELCLAVRGYLQKCRTLSTKNDSGPCPAYLFLPFPLFGDCSPLDYL